MNAHSSQQRSFNSPPDRPEFREPANADGRGASREFRVAWMVALLIIVVTLAVVLVSSPNVRRWLGFGPEPTLLITTDLDCNWKLDGRPQWQMIRAKQSLVVPISLGQHLIEATTTDGSDEFRAMVEIPRAQQYVAAIALDPVRQKRLADEREKAQLAKEEERREEQKREREEKAERDRRYSEAINRGWWQDPQTHLIWPTTDYGSKSWSEAAKECAAQGGRLPSISEWKSLVARGPFEPSQGCYWSSTTGGSGRAWVMQFPQEGTLLQDANAEAVVKCVR